MKFKILPAFLLVFISCTAAAAQNGWMKYRMYDGKFSFSLPCLPKIETKSVKNEGMEAKLRSYSCYRDNVYYIAAFTDFPKGGVPNLVLERAVNDFATGFEGKIIAKKTISIFSHSGRDFLARAVRKDHVSVAAYRYILVRNRLYALGVVKRSDSSVPTQSEKFFSTFALEG